MSDIQIIMVAKNDDVQTLIDEYARGLITYGELYQKFTERGWSTLSLSENVRNIKPSKREQ